MTSDAPSRVSSPRLSSLDALRGLVMFLIAAEALDFAAVIANPQSLRPVRQDRPETTTLTADALPACWLGRYLAVGCNLYNVGSVRGQRFGWIDRSAVGREQVDVAGAIPDID